MFFLFLIIDVLTYWARWPASPHKCNDFACIVVEYKGFSTKKNCVKLYSHMRGEKCKEIELFKFYINFYLENNFIFC